MRNVLTQDNNRIYSLKSRYGITIEITFFNSSYLHFMHNQRIVHFFFFFLPFDFAAALICSLIFAVLTCLTISSNTWKNNETIVGLNKHLYHEHFTLRTLMSALAEVSTNSTFSPSFRASFWPVSWLTTRWCSKSHLVPTNIIGGNSEGEQPWCIKLFRYTVWTKSDVRIN